MLALAAEGAIFIGQNVEYEGTAMFHDLDGVPMDQRLEFPVAEELQLGFSIGLAMQGFLPISIFPRMDFLLRAMDQLVNHLDKLKEMSCGQFDPKVIIRTRIGGKSPLNAGPQHTQDHTSALCAMLKYVSVFRLTNPKDAVEIYGQALEIDKPALVVECFS